MNYIFIYIFNFVLAVLFSVKIYSESWWAPALIIPLVLIITNLFSTTTVEYREKYKKIMQNFIGPLIILYYIGIQIYIFYINLNAWHGILLGLMIGLLFSPLLAPKKW